jgi:hypothetical protein
MRLHLPFPVEWRHSEAAGRRFISPHPSDDLLLVIDAMEPLPPLREPAWLLERVRQDLPPGAMLVVRNTVNETTRLGWPTTVLDSQVVSDRLLEQRITTCYRFLEYCVIAEVRARDLALLFECKDQLRALFAEGRPDWSGSDTSLSRLLAGVER